MARMDAEHGRDIWQAKSVMHELPFRPQGTEVHLRKELARNSKTFAKRLRWS